MDFIYLGLAAVSGLAIWGLACLCQRLQPTGGGRS